MQINVDTGTLATVILAGFAGHAYFVRLSIEKAIASLGKTIAEEYATKDDLREHIEIFHQKLGSIEMKSIIALGIICIASVGCVCQIGKIETSETAPRATFWRSSDIGGSTNDVDTSMEGGGTATATIPSE